jgi:hypothetical protein
LVLSDTQGLKKASERPKNVYEIVDIWELNVNYYDNHKNNGKTTETQSEVIHNCNEGICPPDGQNQEICPPHGQNQTAKPKNQLKINKLNEKSENLRKTILKKKNKNHHHPEKMMTMLITQSNPNPLKKKSSQKERAYSLISTFNPLLINSELIESSLLWTLSTTGINTNSYHIHLNFYSKF